MGGEDADGAGRNVVLVIDEDCAEPLEASDDVVVVDDLVADVDRRSVLLQQDLDDFDRPVDPGAERARRGERPEATVVIESPEDAAKLDSEGKPIAVITQTTLSLDDVAETVDALGERFGDLKRPAADDICYATQNRQDAVKELAKQGATLIFVIGSEASSNAIRLVEVAQRHGATALLIDGESGIDPELLAGHETVGVTAGASTPEELVALVLRGLASFGFDELGEVEVARENVSFRLPREVTSPV